MSRTHFLFFFSVKACQSLGGVLTTCCGEPLIGWKGIRKNGGWWSRPMTFSPVLLRCCSHAQTRSVSELVMRVDGSSSVFTSIMQFFFFFFAPLHWKKKRSLQWCCFCFIAFFSIFPSAFLHAFLVWFWFRFSIFFFVCVYDYIRATSQSFSIDKKETLFSLFEFVSLVRV